MISIRDVGRQLGQRQNFRFSPCLTKDSFQVAFEEGTGVAEVLFGVGRGGSEAVKCFVEDTDEAPLFGKRWNA